MVTTMVSYWMLWPLKFGHLRTEVVLLAPLPVEPAVRERIPSLPALPTRLIAPWQALEACGKVGKEEFLAKVGILPSELLVSLFLKQG